MRARQRSFSLVSIVTLVLLAILIIAALIQGLAVNKVGLGPFSVDFGTEEAGKSSGSVGPGSTVGTSGPVRISVTCEAPPRIRPGELIGLTYSIDATAAVDVGLGAGLYDEQGTDHSTGTGDVDNLPVAAGFKRVSRPFKVPADLKPGSYELTAEVWPANKIGDEGVETLADSHCALVTIP